MTVWLILMDVKIDLFSSFLPGYGPFTNICDIEKCSISYLICRTNHEKHDELYYNVIGCEPLI